MILLCVRLLMYASGNRLVATSTIMIYVNNLLRDRLKQLPSKEKNQSSQLFLGTSSFPDTHFVRFCTTPQIEPGYVYYELVKTLMANCLRV